MGSVGKRCNMFNAMTSFSTIWMTLLQLRGCCRVIVKTKRIKPHPHSYDETWPSFFFQDWECFLPWNTLLIIPWIFMWWRNTTSMWNQVFRGFYFKSCCGSCTRLCTSRKRKQNIQMLPKKKKKKHPEENIIRGRKHIHGINRKETWPCLLVLLSFVLERRGHCCGGWSP